MLCWVKGWERGKNRRWGGKGREKRKENKGRKKGALMLNLFPQNPIVSLFATADHTAKQSVSRKYTLCVGFWFGLSLIRTTR